MKRMKSSKLIENSHESSKTFLQDLFGIFVRISEIGRSGFAEFCGWVLVSSRRISCSTHRLRTQGEMLETPALRCCSDDRPGLMTQL
jgi:hypothetical protein